MALLRDIIGYFQARGSENSIARLTMLVYLADWRAVLEGKAKVSSLDWQQESFEPCMDEVIETVRHDPAFLYRYLPGNDGPGREILRASRLGWWRSLTKENRETLDRVISQTSHMVWPEFCDYVDSTYPIATQTHISLDLEAIKKELLDAIERLRKERSSDDLSKNIRRLDPIAASLNFAREAAPAAA